MDDIELPTIPNSGFNHVSGAVKVRRRKRVRETWKIVQFEPDNHIDVIGQPGFSKVNCRHRTGDKILNPHPFKLDGNESKQIRRFHATSSWLFHENIARPTNRDALSESSNKATSKRIATSRRQSRVAQFQTSGAAPEPSRQSPTPIGELNQPCRNLATFAYTLTNAEDPRVKPETGSRSPVGNKAGGSIIGNWLINGLRFCSLGIQSKN
jgi:hypothetical protein